MRVYYTANYMLLFINVQKQAGVICAVRSKASGYSLEVGSD